MNCLRKGLVLGGLGTVLGLSPLSFAADAAHVTKWPKGVPPEGVAYKADFGSHVLSISHRDKDGHAELHKTKADIMVFQSGEATIVFGGTVVDPRESAPNEVQGPSISGGERMTVTAGDVVHIPAGIPHQFFIAPGHQVTYFLVKVVEPSK
jgi:mannose-6-phosphate isomerase-like protein (cupin superfamily)